MVGWLKCVEGSREAFEATGVKMEWQRAGNIKIVFSHKIAQMAEVKLSSVPLSDNEPCQVDMQGLEMKR